MAEEQSEQQEQPRQRTNRRGSNQTNSAGLLIIIGATMGFLAGYLLFFDVAPVSGVAFAILAMLLAVFSGAQIYAGIRVLQLADAGRRLATWLLPASGVLLLIAVYKEPLPAILGLALDAFGLLALRESAGQFERADEE